MATEHDKLARQMLESSALSKERLSIELSPLEQLIARVTVRWPFPEMGQLEYADWMESLKSFRLGRIQEALDRLMTAPPKRDLADGSTSEYRGRPSLVDLLRTMDILAEESATRFRKDREREEREEMRILEQRRKEHPEEFFGLADVLKAANVISAKEVIKPMPNVKTLWPEIDHDKNRETLRQQAEMLTKREVKP